MASTRMLYRSSKQVSSPWPELLSANAAVAQRTHAAQHPFAKHSRNISTGCALGSEQGFNKVLHSTAGAVTHLAWSDECTTCDAAVQQHHKAPSQQTEADRPREAQQAAASPHARGAPSRPVALETPKDQYNRHLEAARSRSGTLSGNLGHKVQSPKAAALANGEQPLHHACEHKVLSACYGKAIACGALSTVLFPEASQLQCAC